MSIDASASIIDDVLCPGLAVVFCGMAAGPKAAREKTPYVGPNNKFWPTLRALGLIPHDFQPARFRELPAYGFGLTTSQRRKSAPTTRLSSPRTTSPWCNPS